MQELEKHWFFGPFIPTFSREVSAGLAALCTDGGYPPRARPHYGAREPLNRNFNNGCSPVNRLHLSPKEMDGRDAEARLLSHCFNVTAMI